MAKVTEVPLRGVIGLLSLGVEGLGFRAVWGWRRYCPILALVNIWHIGILGVNISLVLNVQSIFPL